MAPARKKQKVEVVERELPTNDGHVNRSVNFSSETLLARPDELRRKTYFIYGEDTSVENESCVMHDAQIEASNNVDRRLTYVIQPHGDNDLVDCSPGIEMNQSENAIAEIRLQENESLLSAAGKPTKRHQKKSASSKDSQLKMLESESGTKISVKAKAKRAQRLDSENISNGPNVQKKPMKKSRKRKNADSKKTTC